MVIVSGVASRTRSKKKERSLIPSPIGSGSRNVFTIDHPLTHLKAQNPSPNFIMGSDDSGSSSFDDEDEEEEKEKRRCKRRKKEKKRREPTFESHSNKVLSCDEVIVETECSGIRKKNGENKNNSSSTENNVFDHQQEKMLPKDADCASVLFGKRNMEGCSSEKNEDKEKNVAKKPVEVCSSKKNEDKEENVAMKPVEGCSSEKNEDKENNVAKKPVEGCSSKKNEDKGNKVAKKPMPAGNRARKRVERTGKNVGADIEASSQKRSRPSPPEEHEKKPVKHKGRESVIDERVPMNDERMGSAEGKRENKKEGEAEGKHKAGADCESSYKEREQHRVTTNPSRPKEAPLIELLAECFRIKHYPDNVHKQDTISKEPALNVQRKFFVPKKVPIEKTESKKERYMLWEEMDALLRLGEVDSLVSEYPREGSRKKLLSDGPNGLWFDDAFGVREGGYCNKEGTVWDLIPADTKQNLYAHQLEGFEFLWKNLAETMEFPKLKSCDSNNTGGCIISHAPGTGKTRLTIVFLQTYLEVFPDCHPMSIALNSLLLTWDWEDEFRKWDNEIPFNNLSNQDTSGKEHLAACSKVGGSAPSQEDIQMVKLYSWFKQPSILGISYS
ncbi:hypothetical protein AHAS_Ahas08G0064400 [Arachis hypogaea]